MILVFFGGGGGGGGVWLVTAYNLKSCKWP